MVGGTPTPLLFPHTTIILSTQKFYIWPASRCALVSATKLVRAHYIVMSYFTTKFWSSYYKVSMFSPVPRVILISVGACICFVVPVLLLV